MREKLRIAIYSGSIPSTTFIENLIIGLANAGHSVYLFGTIKNRPNYAAENIHLFGTPTAKWRVLFFVVWHQIRLWLFRPTSYKKLQKHIFAIEPSYKRRWRLWAKYLPILHHIPDIFHIQWAKATEEWLFLKELFGVKIVLSLRGAHINYSPFADALLLASYRRSFPKVDGFHAVSRAIAQEAQGYGADFNKIQVVYSGLNFEKLKVFEKKSFMLQTPIRLLSVGRFHWKKGYHYALDAAKMLINKGYKLHYTIIADGDSEEILYQIHDLSLQQHIEVIGKIPQKEVFRYMQESDILLLPSVEEGIANVVLEAMAIGLPVVSSDCGGMSEVVEDGVTGFLFENRKSKHLATQIIAALELSTVERKQMIKSAKDKMTAQHKLSNTIENMLQFYKEIQETIGTSSSNYENRFSFTRTTRLF